jgi:hypothetical protein
LSRLVSNLFLVRAATAAASPAGAHLARKGSRHNAIPANDKECLNCLSHPRGQPQEIDRWEHAHFQEEELRNKAKAAKKDYEGALRFKFFAIPE